MFSFTFSIDCLFFDLQRYYRGNLKIGRKRRRKPLAGLNRIMQVKVGGSWHKLKFKSGTLGYFQRGRPMRKIRIGQAAVLIQNRRKKWVNLVHRETRRLRRSRRYRLRKLTRKRTRYLRRRRRLRRKQRRRRRRRRRRRCRMRRRRRRRRRRQRRGRCVMRVRVGRTFKKVYFNKRHQYRINIKGKLRPFR